MLTCVGANTGECEDDEVERVLCINAHARPHDRYLVDDKLRNSSWQPFHTGIYSLMLSSPLEGGTLQFTELSWQVQALTLSVCSALKCRKVRELTVHLPVLMLV